jgi:hypothetical protein
VDQINENITCILEEVTHAMKSTEVWIGRFDVRPKPGNTALGSAKGAVVNVVALARDEREYLRLVEEAMTEYDFEVLHHEDVATLARWTVANRLHPQLAGLANQLTEEFPIQFDEFQSYLSDDG